MADLSGAQMEPQIQALMASYRDYEVKEALWARRRLGLSLASMVLLLGGFWATGMLKLHDKVAWAVVEPKDDDL